MEKYCEQVATRPFSLPHLVASSHSRVFLARLVRSWRRRMRGRLSYSTSFSVFLFFFFFFTTHPPFSFLFSPIRRDGFAISLRFSRVEWKEEVNGKKKRKKKYNNNVTLEDKSLITIIFFKTRLLQQFNENSLM